MSKGLNGKTIVLGVSGGIAAYKAAALCSKLAQAGAEVRVIMTASAVKFVAPLTFQTLSRHEVAVDTFDEKDASVVQHIDLADRADLFVVAPATANVIGKMAHGLGDDMLSTTLLATTAPVLVAPAMNVHMYAHPAVQQNMKTLADRGVRFVEPGTGQLACGYVGKGRLAEPEEIMRAIEQHFAEDGRLKGKRVLITAGATLERIDPVRYISNDSSGKMGYAIAEAAARMGADVTLVSGKVSVPVPPGVTLVQAESTLEMRDAVLSRMDDQDVIIKAAAVADYRPAEQYEHKLKKMEDEMTMRLVKNPDILQLVGERKTKQLVVGFAAETRDLEKFAMDKLQRKRCDLLVANNVTLEGAGFGTDTNIVRIFDASGLVEALPMLGKREVASRLLSLIADRLTKGDATGA
ncbi:bifunctional phosphopantothenoylcysteine decarboxylase/phosphopantothenate--cysteine ligase CoaBC [Paenibacillus validus]|uniref:bifunctional phosphopantothenoylcysteine decarboxylase/phosphopantothenate--cysteine ligase CoaBC n=1 Tax=Paenibacillus TaxID=44249 RepID=UPI000FD8BAC0|nr:MULTISPECIES: bifunctional phosphopantothenoylcysteine decarboxylase/phosphopantothenate--cysteine ligase CoaBC [Paenibacillus]MED4604214.1 bifunctional phosphopantothenoylcysteine decarboxylase/phosphopantothenate--cysteine ligase CoaBC [Paenibacillus validus]MED4609863.1 bifunctional phosphopantothenoylcysteine decarboxylase/phosphopantothenate--cysteine ligase CoaBC [Paenibacillus validus]